METTIARIENIIAYGQEYNREWVDTNPSHWLVKTYDVLHRRSIIFLSTSCEITAEMMRWKLSEWFEKWELLDDVVSFEEVRTTYPVFQISIGEDWFNNEHVVTIFNDSIIQSYYAAYTIKKNVITQDIISAFNEGTGKDAFLTNESYKVITRGQSFDKGKNVCVYYWIPTASISL